jgi:hypothetical protein
MSMPQFQHHWIALVLLTGCFSLAGISHATVPDSIGRNQTVAHGETPEGLSTLECNVTNLSSTRCNYNVLL